MGVDVGHSAAPNLGTQEDRLWEDGEAAEEVVRTPKVVGDDGTDGSRVR